MIICSYDKGGGGNVPPSTLLQQQLAAIRQQQVMQAVMQAPKGMTPPSPASRAPRHTENPYCEMVTPLRPFVVQDPSLFPRLPGHKRVFIAVSKEMEFLGMPGCPALVLQFRRPELLEFIQQALGVDALTCASSQFVFSFQTDVV